MTGLVLQTPPRGITHKSIKELDEERKERGEAVAAGMRAARSLLIQFDNFGIGNPAQHEMQQLTAGHNPDEIITEASFAHIDYAGNAGNVNHAPAYPNLPVEAPAAVPVISPGFAAALASPGNGSRYRTC